MNDTFRLGRIGGVRVGINWSLLVMAAALTAGLANSRLPADRPGYAAVAYWLAAAAATILLLVGVLVHELAHAVVARRAGMTVDGITLWFMGGMTRIEGESGAPGVELRVSGVGPLVSALVGGICWVAALICSGLGLDPLPVDALGWLAAINVALAVFNLIPASPLDGGRVLHAGVWALTHDRWRATRIASGAGEAFGIAIVVGGGVLFTRGVGFDGVLVAALGWFLFVSARAERQAGEARRALDGITVADLMRPVRAAPGWLTVDALLAEPSTPPATVLMLESWGQPGYAALVARDALEAIPRFRRQELRGLDVGVPISHARGVGMHETVIDAVTREGANIVLVIAGDRTVGAVLPADVERYVRTGQRPAAISAGRVETDERGAPVH